MTFTQIIQDTERKINMGSTWISGNATRLADFTAYANNTMSRVWHKIWSSYAGWQYDDSNQTDLPQANADFTSGTSLYSLPTTALTIKRIDLTDSAGNNLPLTPILTEQIDTAIDLTATGTPTHYRLIGNSIQFYPIPNYTTTSNAGFKVVFDRAGVAFATDDTTQTPGFASEYHELVPLGMAIAWMKIKEPQSATLAQYRIDYAQMMEELGEFYANRFEANIPIIRGQEISFE